MVTGRERAPVKSPRATLLGSVGPARRRSHVGAPRLARRRQRAVRLAEQYRRLVDRREHTPRQRQADSQPAQRDQGRAGRLHVGCGVGGAVWIARGAADGLVREALLGGQLLIGHEVFVGHRAHQQVADKTQHQQSGQDVHGHIVGLGAGHAARQLEFADIVDEHRAEHAGRRPGGQQAAVDGADHLGAEQVGQVGRDGGEAAAVHGQDDAESADEQSQIARLVAGEGSGRVEDDAQDEKDEVSALCARCSRTATPRRSGRRC